MNTPVRGAGIVVTNVATGQPATVYSDEDLTTVVASPVADSNGVYQFYVPPGTYSITFTGLESFMPAEQVHIVGDDTSPSGTSASAADVANFAADLSAHEVDTTGVHGITDTTKLLTDVPIVALKVAGTTYWQVPGGTWGGSSTGSACNANEDRHTLFTVREPITITDIGVEASTVPGVAGHVRVGIYSASADGQPTGAPLLDVEVAIPTSSGVQTLTLGTPLALTTGAYVLVTNCDEALTLRSFSGSTPHGVIGGSSSPYVGWASVTRTYGAMANPAPASTAVTASGAANRHVVLFKVSSA